MNRQTHNNLAKVFYPNIPYKSIDRVNAAIDNPNRKMVALQNSGMFSNKELDFFKLTKHGHRKYNHNVQSAFVAAYMADPKHAMELALVHLLADRFSNKMHDSMGRDDKEMAEAMLNKQINMFKMINGMNSRKRRTPRMFH